MTEAEWDACADPGPMLEFVRDGASDRRLRLFAVACGWRLVGHCSGRSYPAYVPVPAVVNGVEVAERHADGLASGEELAAASSSARRASAAIRGRDLGHASRVAAEPALDAARGVAIGQDTGGDSAGALLIAKEMPAQANLLRCLFSPFRPVAVDPAYRAPAVLSIARAAYDERHLPSGHLDAARLLVLADALEEAGATDAALLAHLRSAGPHVRGCFAVDAILGLS
jgi:hypothetical protein